MSVEKSTAIQILVAWRENKWIVARNAAEIGAYAYKSHAMDMAREVAADAAALGLPCYMLVRDRDGSWDEHTCPRPVRGDRSN
jgi:hypothetical protein